MTLYQHVLTVDPSNPDALHLSGMVELVRGRVAEAIARMERAVASFGAGEAIPAHFRSNLANAFREAGELERAEAEYRAAIATGGGTPEVFNNLGLTLLALGRPTWAIEAFEASLARRPRHPATLTNLSVACLAAGAAAEALRCADEALSADATLGPAILARAAALAALDRRSEALDLYRGLVTTPLAPGALRGLSDALFAEGRATEAVEISSRVVQGFPDDATAWTQHGLNLIRVARVVEAEAAFARACEICPVGAAPWGHRGAALLTLGRYADAVKVLRRATQLDAGHAEAWTNLSTALLAVKDGDGAVEAAERAVRLTDRSLEALEVLGAALLGARRFDAAHGVFSELIAKRADADAWNGLGVSLERLGRVVEARDAYARAVSIDAGHTVAKLNHAETLLLLGDFENGWKAYQSRFAYLQQAGVRGPDSSKPRWAPGVKRLDGAAPTVLLIAEQGLGDAIQFVRFASVLRKEAARVVVQAPEGVARLLAAAPGVDAVIGFSDACDHDFAIHAMSLPATLGTSLESIPAEVPYLAPPQDAFEAWRARLGRRRGLRVALAWAGSPGHSHDASRSIPLSLLEPLAALQGIEWFSVQKGPGSEQLAAVSSKWSIADLGPALGDMSETAAVLAHMDLIICVDTSVAHLAGAIGARTWTLLAHPPEWRWLLDRRDTPWYPTMTLFRQREVDQWGPVVARVRHRLERLVRSKVH